MGFVALDAIIGVGFVLIVCGGFAVAWWVEQRRRATYEWEVFNPTTGNTLLTVKDEATARRLSGQYVGTDYARRGEGWV